MTSQLNTWVIDVFGLFFDMLSMGDFTTRLWQTTGRLVQELDVCTVLSFSTYDNFVKMAENGNDVQSQIMIILRCI